MPQNSLRLRSKIYLKPARHYLVALAGLSFISGVAHTAQFAISLTKPAQHMAAHQEGGDVADGVESERHDANERATSTDDGFQRIDFDYGTQRHCLLVFTKFLVKVL